MAMRKIPLFSLLLLGAVAACGGGSKNNGPDASPPPADGTTGVDSGTDTPAGSGIVISGAAMEITAGGNMPVSGATIAAFSNTDETTPAAMATTDAQGMYSLTLPMTGG